MNLKVILAILVTVLPGCSQLGSVTAPTSHIGADSLSSSGPETVELYSNSTFSEEANPTNTYKVLPVIEPDSNNYNDYRQRNPYEQTSIERNPEEVISISSRQEVTANPFFTDYWTHLLVLILIGAVALGVVRRTK
jgi:hypothetical protein|tara:strand:- start:2954 stop:3361 length:408 start_codon:yes stop_codon:yes gene_type:complete